MFVYFASVLFRYASVYGHDFFQLLTFHIFSSDNRNTIISELAVEYESRVSSVNLPCKRNIAIIRRVSLYPFSFGWEISERKPFHSK